MPHLEIVELVLVHCDLVNNDYLQDSTILCKSVPNKPFGSVLETLRTNHIFLKTFNSEFKNISARRSAVDEIKTASKRAIQKTAEETGYLIGNKIANKITNVSKKSSTQLHSKELPLNEANIFRKKTANYR